MKGPEFQPQPFPEGDRMDVTEAEKKTGAQSDFDEKIARLKRTIASRLVKKPVPVPAPAPVFDGKLAAAGVDKDDDELIDDGNGGFVLRKYAN